MGTTHSGALGAGMCHIHRSLRVYSSRSLKLLSAVNRSALWQGGVAKIRLYHDESMPSFFRRLTYSPDGALLITPGGSGQYQGLNPAGKHKIIDTN